MRADCLRSLANLGADHIDLFPVHFGDPDTPIEETSGAPAALAEEGLIRWHRIGHLPPDRVAGYLEAGDPFSLLMELSAVARTSRETLLPLCADHGTAAIAFSTTGRSVLTGAIGPETAFPPEDIRGLDPCSNGSGSPRHCASAIGSPRSPPRTRSHRCRSPLPGYWRSPP